MPNRKALYLILLALFTLAAILAGIIYYEQKQSLKVIFFDVGQGDSILIEQGSKQILIDGGPDGKKVMEKLGEYVPFWDRQIEVVIATHPDQDHIDGLVDVLENYNVGEVIDSGVKVETQIFKKLKEVEEVKGVKVMEGKAGMNVEIGDGAKLEILSPDGTEDKENPKDTNISSIVSRLTFGDNSFLFTGDMTAEKELALIGNALVQHSRVLKIAHHGSKYATSEEFLNAVDPSEAVISVGKNNRYGHPAPDVLSRLEAHKIIIKRTDEKGDIEYEF
ncbi:MAG TPA: ComEC/Rec2 family competence protein [Patescibacteria group bacterium]|nr:ComEC/Rec2 family competence protein [Patescibacteria group bacterium]